jgi:hypothetical protein
VAVGGLAQLGQQLGHRLLRVEQASCTASAASVPTSDLVTENSVLALRVAFAEIGLEHHPARCSTSAPSV